MAELKRISYFDTFPQGLVYPGHPVCIALLVMLKYPDLETAVAKPSEDACYGNAVSDTDIPGAGANAHAGVEVLRRARSQGAEEAFAYGETYWRECASGENFGKNHDAGQQQAESIKERFLLMADRWARAQQGAEPSSSPAL
jgi:hypothetical protein